MGCCGGGSYRDAGYGWRRNRGRAQDRNESGRETNATPMELLKERLAKGEITLEEYQQISQALSS